MQPESRNIYRNARKTAGLTQERWAESLGISTEAVRQYETGKILPSDDVALSMAEIAGQPIFCYWHLTNKSRLAAAILPDLVEKRLPEAVLDLLVQFQTFQEDGLADLLRIAADGRVDENEQAAYARAVGQISNLVGAGLALLYTKEGES